MHSIIKGISTASFHAMHISKGYLVHAWMSQGQIEVEFCVFYHRLGGDKGKYLLQERSHLFVTPVFAVDLLLQLVSDP